MFVASVELYDIFKFYQERRFVLVKPGGNFGDELIYLGCEKILKQLDINYETIDYSGFIDNGYPENRVIYIHGGGGVNPFCSGKAIQLIVKAVNTHKGIVISGPQTYFDDKEFVSENLFNKIKSSAQKVYLFARDLRSYSILKSCARNCSFDLRIDHDTALNLESCDFNNAKNFNRMNRFFIRNDREATVKGGIFQYFTINKDPVTFAKNFEAWINLHSTADVIYTNRLHSAIAGKIFLKNVFLLPNAYHKNRTTWEYSLAKLPNIKWLEGFEGKHVSCPKFLGEISNSIVFQKFITAYCLGYSSLNNYNF